MVYTRDQPMVEVRETEIKNSGVDVVRRRDFPQEDQFEVHIPPGLQQEALRQLAEHVDGYEIVSSDEAELIELAKDTLCD